MNQMNQARLSTRAGNDVLLEAVKASGDLRGPLLEMKVEQQFRNATDGNIEVVYSFPLPWDAVLLAVDVRLGDDLLTGVVVEKKQAEARYEETLSEGHAAIMLERNHDLSYTLNVGNLAAAETCVIILRYAQTLQFEQGGLRLLIPTVIAPRYGNPMRDGGLKPHQTTEHSMLAEYPFDIELRLHGELAHARVASPTHPIGVSARATLDDVLTVSLACRGALDRDFVLVVDELVQHSMVTFMQDSVQTDQTVAMASFCPRFESQASKAVAVKLLVDCSSSMGGDSIDAARRALQAIVSQLRQGDRFSLSRFGSEVVHRSRTLWNTTERTRLAAQRWVGELQADLGGTEMEAALRSTCQLGTLEPTDLLILTDGEIDAIDQTIQSAQASGHRVFVVGIGSSVAESHLRRLAEATSGACDFVASGEAVEAAVLRMFTRLRPRRFDAISVVWPGEKRPSWVSAVPRAVFEGDNLSLFALLPSIPEGDVCLMGMSPEGERPHVLAKATFGAAIESCSALARVAAHARVKACGARAPEEAARLSLAYGLVTERTNYLLVHQRAAGEEALDMPELYKVAQMVPAGWGATSTARSASGANLPIPTVWRTDRSMGSAAEQTVFFRQVAYDTAKPLFSRKTAVGMLEVKVKTFDYPLSPLDCSEKLRGTALALRPSSYAELRSFGLAAAVVDWLELAVAAQEGPPHTEFEWVAAFVLIMSQDAVRDAFTMAIGRRGLRGIAKRFKALFSDASEVASTSIDDRLGERLIIALDGLSADAWPDQVYAMRADRYAAEATGSNA
ncbi:hypothetical protein BH11PSE13_BH11PSE13_43570 [soil metagenome]